MVKMFKLNGEIYCKLFAWTPVCTSDPNNRQWLWLTNYYIRMAHRGRAVVVMSKDGFFIDYNRRG